MALILFRADASPEMGTGHVMRCLALAEALIARGHQCRLAAATITPALEARATALRVEVGPADSLDGAALIVVDGYHFDATTRAEIRAKGAPVLTFDDGTSLGPLHADIVVNAAREASEADYRDTAPGATLLLGPRYVPLRLEFSRFAPRPRRHLLVSFGGSDPLGLTAPVVERLLAVLPDAELAVLLGGSVADPESTRLLAAAHPDRVALHEDTSRVAALMAASRLAVSAAGGTLAELACLEVPSLLVVVAENQVPHATASAADGWCEVLDGRAPGAIDAVTDRAAALWRDTETLAAMSQSATGLIDGFGVTRIADAIEAALRGPLTPTLCP